MPRTCSQCMVDRKQGSKHEVRVRSCQGQGWQEATWSEQVCGRSSGVKRPRMKEARGKEGREKDATWKKIGETG